MPGVIFKEFVFFHKVSRTLILTDTIINLEIINLELDKLTEPWRTATKLSGMYHPRGQIFFRDASSPPVAEEEGEGGDQNGSIMAA